MSRGYCSIVPATTLTNASISSPGLSILREMFERKECRTGHENRGPKIAGLVAERTTEIRSVAIGSFLQALDTSSPTVEPRRRLLPRCADQALSLPSIWSCAAEKEGALPGSATVPTACRRLGSHKKRPSGHTDTGIRFHRWNRTNPRLTRSAPVRS